MYKKEIKGTLSGRIYLFKPTTTQGLFDDMSDHLGKVSNGGTWAWSDESYLILQHDGNKVEFAKQLEQKVSKEYADWFRGAVGIAVTTEDEIYSVEFENIKFDIRNDSRGLWPIVEKQHKKVGLFLAQTKKFDEISFKSATVPEIASVRTVYLGGVDSSGNLTGRTSDSPDQTSKKFDTRREVSHKIIKALIGLGKANPSVFGQFISSNVESVPTMTPSDENKIVINYEKFHYEITKTESTVRFWVKKQDNNVGLHFRHTTRSISVDGESFQFESSNQPIYGTKHHKLWLAGCDSLGEIKGCDYSAELAESWPVIKKTANALVKYLDKTGIAGAKIDTVTSSEAPKEDSSVWTKIDEIKSENLELTLLKKGSEFKYIVGKQTSKVGSHLWSRKAHSGFKFECYSTMRFDGTILFLRGVVGASGVLSNSSTELFATTSNERIVQAVKALKEYVKCMPSVFGKLVEPATETISEKSSEDYLVETENLRVQYIVKTNTLSVTKQEKKIGEFLWSSKKHGDFWFECASCPEIQSNKMYLHGCAPDGTLRTRKDNSTVRECYSSNILKKAFTNLLGFVRANESIFGKLKSSNIPGVKEMVSTGNKYILKTEKLEVWYDVDTSTLSVPTQHRDIGQFLWCAKTVNGYEFECCDSPEIRTSKMFLHGCGPDGTLRSGDSSGSRTQGVSIDKVKEAFQKLEILVKKKEDVFGKFIASSLSGSATIEAAAPMATSSKTELFVEFENYRIDIIIDNDSIDIRVPKRSREVEQSRYRGSKYTIESCNTPQLRDTNLFIAGNTASEYKRPLSANFGGSRAKAEREAINALNDFIKVGKENAMKFGSFVSASPTLNKEPVLVPTEKLFVKFENLHVEMEVSDKCVYRILKQSSDVREKLNALTDSQKRPRTDGYRITDAGCIEFSSVTLFLKGQNSKTEHTSSSKKKDDAILALTDLMSVGLAHGVFGKFIESNIPKPSVEPIHTETTVEYFVKFKNLDYRVSKTGDRSTLKVPHQTSEVSSYASSCSISFDGLTLGRSVEPEFGSKIWLAGTRQEKSWSGYGHEKICRYLNAMIKHGLAAPEVFGPLVEYSENIGYTPEAPKMKITSTPVHEDITASAPCSEIIMSDAEPTSPETVTTKMMVFGMATLESNKEVLIVESKRQFGKVVLGQAESRIAPHLPDMMKPVLESPFGKMLVANAFVIGADAYTGPNQDKIDTIADSVLAAAASEIGDWFNFNGVVDKFIETIKAGRI